MNAFPIPCRDLERLVRDRVGSLLLRPASIVAASFALDFAGDLLTDRRWSALWGCGAIVCSLLGAVARLRAPARAVGAYAGTWLAFGLLRAIADDAWWAIASLDAVPRLEARLLGGELPLAALQGWLFDPDRNRWYDGLATAVHLSFFVVPHAVAAWLLWRCPTVYRRYVLATALVFAVGLAGFVLLPTSPPWMTAGAASETGRDPVHRIADVALLRLGLPLREDAAADRDQGLGFEPNPVAATPSIHLAVTALLALVLRRAVPGGAWAGLTYTCLMTGSLVYLGSTTSSTSRPARS